MKSLSSQFVSLLVLLFIAVSFSSFSQDINISYNTSAFPGGYNVSCYGGSDGYISVSFSGGNSPYLYQWTNSDGTFASTSQNLINVPAGIYTIVVTGPGSS